MSCPLQALTTAQQFVGSMWHWVFVVGFAAWRTCHLIQKNFIPSVVHSIRFLMASERLACLLVTSGWGIIPWRYVTFIREQSPVLPRLTTDPLPESSLPSHTRNGNFLDTWPIRIFANTTNTWRQPVTDQVSRTIDLACVCLCVWCVTLYIKNGPKKSILRNLDNVKKRLIQLLIPI